MESLIIPKERFHGLISERAQELLRLSLFLERENMDPKILTRPLLGAVLSQATQMEELLDAYRARNNQRWFVFRELVASLKLFSDVCYMLLHLQHSIPRYHLLEVEGDLESDFDEMLFFSGSVLFLLAARMAQEARNLELPLPEDIPEPGIFKEELPKGYLTSDRASRHVISAEETVTGLATVFLNLAAASKLLHVPDTVAPKDYAACVPDPIGEKELRRLQQEFHNLQSLYDTHVLDTDTEDFDPDLKVLRGHVSVIYHLLELATAFVHFYERHVRFCASDSTTLSRPFVNPEMLLKILMESFLSYASRYLKSARNLCHRMLKRYAKVEKVTVPVPRYRGFHVRPSTLVSKIVLHYGSEVVMHLGDETYDASTPLELFRANEKINAEKRHAIGEEISSMVGDNSCGPPEEIRVRALGALQHLVAMNKIVLYIPILDLEEVASNHGETLLQFCTDAVAHLLAVGKIDILSEIEVTFEGDRRVLADLELLAQNGYGEDAIGNNIPLPEVLRYLRL
ncbi:MAG: hypothetical protein JXA52_03330 [Planctomycetes bacterium]|nr:hypothetical protein [Planctomycetota bacterium]